MRRFLAPLLIWSLLASNAMAGEVIKRGPHSNTLYGVTESGTGNYETLGFLNALDRFRALDMQQLRTQIWFDPTSGDDFSGDGTYASPFRSISKMKSVCASYTRCTVKGRGQVFAALVVKVDPATLAANEEFQVGEAVTDNGGTWNGGTSGTGTVLAWDPATLHLTLTRDGGTALEDPIRGDAVAGSTSGAVITVDHVFNSIAGGVQFVPADVTAAADTITADAHGFVDGEGPVYFQTVGAGSSVPGGVSAGTAYYIMSVTGTTFQVDDVSPPTTPINLTSGGVGLHTVGQDNSIADNPFTPDCADQDRICTLIESEFPESRFTIDGNRFDSNHDEASDTDGMFVSAGAGDGWLGVQNVNVQNLASDNFSTATTGGGAKLVALNTRATGVRNGAESRSDTSIFSNNCYTSHGVSAGTIIVLNGADSESRSTSSSGGSCVALTQLQKNIFIGQGMYLQSEAVAVGQYPVSINIGDVVFIGAHFKGGPSFGGAVQLHGLGGVAARSRLQIARSVLETTNVGNNNILLINNDEANDPHDVLLYEVTWKGRGRGITVDSLSATGNSIFGRYLLMDNLDWWLATFDATAHDNSTLDIQFSVYDDEDGVGDANEFVINGFGALTLSAAQTLVNAESATWSSFWTNSVNSGAGADGTQWGTDTVFQRCQSGQLCFEAAAAQQSYTIDLKTIYGTDPDDSCIPADVMGRRICALSLQPIHYGAR